MGREGALYQFSSEIAEAPAGTSLGGILGNRCFWNGNSCDSLGNYLLVVLSFKNRIVQRRFV